MRQAPVIWSVPGGVGFCCQAVGAGAAAGTGCPTLSFCSLRSFNARLLAVRIRQHHPEPRGPRTTKPRPSLPAREDGIKFVTLGIKGVYLVLQTSSGQIWVETQ